MFRPDRRGALRRELDGLMTSIRRGLAAAAMVIAKAFVAAANALASLSRWLSNLPPKRSRKRLSRRRGRKWREKQAAYILPFRRKRDAS